VNAATFPRDRPLEERLLHVDSKAGTVRDARVGDLPSLFRAGDLLVVNDAATLPGSLAARTGEPFEVRLLSHDAGTSWQAVLFGPGDWRTRTEERLAPPRLRAGDRMVLGAHEACVVAVDARSPRLVTLRIDATVQDLYRMGKPVQYAYVERDLALWHVQTAYASRPWAAEMPSAGRPLTWGLLLALRRRGVALASLTHAAGLSSTGDAELDARLPLPERYEIPLETVRAIARTKQERGRIVAVGTTVVRALEGAALAGDGVLVAGAGATNLRIGPGFRPRVTDGLLTGVHDPAASHFALLQAFAPQVLLERAYAHAEQEGYLGHEFGDSSLILPG